MFDFLMERLVKGYRTDSNNPAVREKCGTAAGAVGIVTNLLLFAMKLLAGLWSHSVAILADAVNNLTDSGSSIITMVGFRLAAKPADEEHPYGHARLEYLSGVAVSFIVLFLGLQLGMNSIEKIKAPEETVYSVLSIGILVVSILVKLWQFAFYRSVGKKIDSEAIFATSGDSRNDAISTAVVLLGALITKLSGLNLDGFLGLAVAVFILVSGVKLVIETADPLLGAAPDKELVQKIYTKVLSYDGIIGLHDLEVHSYGAGRCFVSVHCEVPAEENILKSHDLIDNIERDFLQNENIHLVIHLDPIVTSDERTNDLRGQVTALVLSLYPQVSLHDFRVVWGVTHSNIVFDVAVPFSLHESETVMQKKIAQAVESLDETYRAVVTVEHILA